MKIGVNTNRFDGSGYGRWGDQAYQKLKEHGFSCTDFGMMDTETDLYLLPQQQADEILLREKELAHQAGIEIWQAHGPWRTPKDATEEDRCERMQKMQRSIRSAAILGCKHWVIHPIMPFGLSDVGNGDAQKTWDLNLAFMRELLETAKEYDVTVCLENMPFGGFSLSTPEQILGLVQAIDDPHFRICLDTGHVACLNLSLAQETRRLGNYIKTLHVHDSVPNRDDHAMPFFGKIDWAEFSKALKEIDFQGVFSFETLPPRALPTPIFEELCQSLVKTAKIILGEA